MAYNLLNYPGSDSATRNPYFRTVISSINPDILSVGEMAGGQAGVTNFLNMVVNSFGGGYAAGTYIANTSTSGESDNAIYYRTSKFIFLSNTPIKTALRDINEFKLIHIASGDTIRIYSVHLKASTGTDNELKRSKEVDSLRKVTNSLPAGCNFIVCGDFNIYSSNEAAYIKLIQDDTGNDGNFIDPIIMPYPSDWQNSLNAKYSTQSPRKRQFGGGSTGGMDDRFDLILFSNAVNQEGGMHYVPGSTVAYGNDSSHYKDSINRPTNYAVGQEIANAIHYAADHIPVYAKFAFNYSSAPTAQPTNLQFSNNSSSAVNISFTASEPASAGYLIVRKNGSLPTGTPINGTAYEAGDALGDGIVVYSGAGTTCVSSGLNAGTTYYYAVYAYNSTGSSSVYLTSNPLTGSSTTLAGIPAAQPTNLLFSSIASTSMNLNFSVSSPASNGYIVLMKSGSLPETAPVSGTAYTAGTTLGDATVLYSGSSTSCSATGLSSNTAYYFAVYSFNGSGSTINYLTTNPLSSSATTLASAPTAQPTNLQFANISTTSADVSFTAASPAADGYIVIRRSGAAPTGAPVNGTAYSAGNTIGDGTVVYSGSGTSFTNSSLSAATTYYYKVFSYNGSGANAVYLTTNPLSGSTITLASAPTAQPTNLQFASITSSSMGVSFTASSPAAAGYIVLYKAGSAPIGTPTAGTTYSAGNTIGDGTVAYSGSGLSFTNSSLSAATNYYYSVFAYNGSGAAINYFTSSPLSGSAYTLAAAPTAQPTQLTFSSVNSISMDLSFTAASPAADGYLVLRKAGSAPTGTPVNGVAYSAGNTLGDAVIVSSGSALTASNTGLAASTTYYFKVFSFNGSGVLTNYLTGSPLSGSQATTSPSPIISVSPASLSFSNVAINAFSTEQTYTVSGSYLSGNLSVTPPAGWQVSLTSGSGFVSNPSSLSITPVSGSIPTTTIYIRFSPQSAEGSVNGTITNSSSGASTQSVSVSGVSLAVEPTVSGTISIASTDPGALIVNFTGGSGQRRIVFMRQGSAVNFTPSDAAPISGVNPNFSSATDQGNGNKAVYDGTGNTITVSGLVNATTYYLAVYEYNAGTNNSQNYLTSSYGTANVTTDGLPTKGYFWVTGSTNFSSSSSWSPAHSPGAGDTLNFITAAAENVIVSASVTFGQLNIMNGTTVNMSASTASTLIITGSAGNDLTVSANSALNFTGDVALTCSLATGTTGAIYGSVAFSGATKTTAHKLIAKDSAALQFYSGSSFTAGNYFLSNAFGNTNSNSVIFKAGSSYNFYSGSNPFGITAPATVVIFEQGSWFRCKANNQPAFSGRTYANFEFNAPIFDRTATGGSACTFDTLMLTSGSPIFNMTGGLKIKNDLIIGAGTTLWISTDNTTMNISMNGTSSQTISGSGTLSLGSGATLVIDNAAGVKIKKDITINKALNLLHGVLDLENSSLTIGSTASIIDTMPTPAVITTTGSGALKKVFAGNGQFTFPLGMTGTSSVSSPLNISLTGYGSLGDGLISASIKSGKHTNNSDGSNYLQNYWTVSASGITSPVVDAIFRYSAAKISGQESSLYMGRWDGSAWSLLSAANTVDHNFTVNGLTSFGDFTAAGSDYMGGAGFLDAKIIPQGLYDSVNNRLRIKDTVTVYLRGVTSPYTIIDSSSAVIDSTSFSGRFTFRNAPGGTYYFSVKHRNSLETWSRTGGESFSKGTTMTYDLTSDSLKAYGANMVKVNGKWCIYCGDLNQDGSINYTDIRLLDVDLVNHTVGHPVSDVNGDGIVDFSDMVLVENNAYRQIGKQKP